MSKHRQRSDIYKLVKKQALKLITQLEKDIRTKRVVICENYGQEKIRKFKGESDFWKPPFKEQCEISALLETVADIH